MFLALLVRDDLLGRDSGMRPAAMDAEADVRFYVDAIGALVSSGV